MSYMQKQVLNYRIIIEKEKAEGKNAKYIYTASCPVLGLYDFGKTIDEAIERMTHLIAFHIDSLTESGYKVPVEKDTTTVVTSINIPILPHTKLSFV